MIKTNCVAVGMESLKLLHLPKERESTKGKVCVCGWILLVRIKTTNFNDKDTCVGGDEGGGVPL
jgi:hypothetical protein